jgi:hypothetical protein
MVADLLRGFLPGTAAIDLQDLLEPAPVGLESYQPRMRYLLIDEGRYSDETLSSLDRNLVAALFRLEKGWPPDALLEVLAALLDWLRDPRQESLQRAFTEWLKRVWSQPKLAEFSAADWSKANSLLEVHDMLAERIREWSEQLVQQGLQQGRTETLEVALYADRQLLVRMARLKFGENCAKELAIYLAEVDNSEKFAQIGECLIESADQASFLSRVKALVEST